MKSVLKRILHLPEILKNLTYKSFNYNQNSESTWDLQ